MTAYWDGMNIWSTPVETWLLWKTQHDCGTLFVRRQGIAKISSLMDTKVYERSPSSQTVTRTRLQIVQEEVVNVSAAGNRSAADVRDAFSWQCTERATVHFGWCIDVRHVCYITTLIYLRLPVPRPRVFVIDHIALYTRYLYWHHRPNQPH